MICPKCGREIPEGTRCVCSSGMPVPPPYGVLEPAFALSSNPAVNVIKTIGSSPLFLTAAIFYSLIPLLLVITVVTGGGGSIARAMAEAAARSDPGFTASTMQPELPLIFQIIMVLVCSIPTVIMAVGMWMHYAACRNKTTGNVSTAGLTVCKVLTVIGLAVWCALGVFYVIAIIVSVFAGGFRVNGRLVSPFDDATVMAGFAVLLLLCLVLIIGFFAVKILFDVCVIKTVNRMKATAFSGVPDNRIPRYLTSMLYVVAVFLGFYSLMFMLLSFTLGFAVMAKTVANILIAVCLGRQRQRMTALLYPPVQPIVYMDQPVQPGQAGYAQPVPSAPPANRVAEAAEPQEEVQAEKPEE